MAGSFSIHPHLGSLPLLPALLMLLLLGPPPAPPSLGGLLPPPLRGEAPVIEGPLVAGGVLRPGALGRGETLQASQQGATKRSLVRSHTIRWFARRQTIWDAVLSARLGCCPSSKAALPYASPTQPPAGMLPALTLTHCRPHRLQYRHGAEPRLLRRRHQWMTCCWRAAAWV